MICLEANDLVDQYYCHGNGQHWVNGQITSVHIYPWPTCGLQTVHTNCTIVWLISLDIWSALQGYLNQAWPEVDLPISRSNSLLIFMHVASISVRLCVSDLWLWGRLGASFIDNTTQWRSTWDLYLIPHAIDKHTAIVSQLIEWLD